MLSLMRWKAKMNISIKMKAITDIEGIATIYLYWTVA